MSDIIFGTSPNTGDTVRQGLAKLSARAAALEAAAGGGGTPAYVPPTLTVSSVTQAEGNSGSVLFIHTVTRTGDLTRTASANYAVLPQGSTTAAAFTGNAYPTGVVSFAIGETTKTISIPVAGNTDVEANKVYTLVLSNALNAVIDSSGTGTIVNDDAAPQAGDPTFDASIVPLYIQLETDRNAPTLSLRVFTDKTHQLGGSIWAYAYPNASLTGPTIFKTTPTEAEAESEVIPTLNAGLAALTGTQRVECFWVTPDNRISRASNLLLWGANDVAPLVSNPKQAENITSSTANIGANTDTIGGTFYTVLTLTPDKPSKSQVEQGKNAAGQAAFGLSQPVTSIGFQPVAASELTDGDEFFVWYAHKPAVGPTSEVLAGGSFSTASASVFAVEYLDAFAMARGNPTIINDLPIGEDDANRQLLIMCFNYGDQPNFRVNGELATFVPGADSANRAYIINVPVGQTADIALEAGFVSSTATVGIWKIVGGVLQTPAIKSPGGFQEVANQRIPIDTPDGAVTVFAAWSSNGNATGVSDATLQDRIVWASDFGTGATYFGQRNGPSTDDIAFTGGGGASVDMAAFNIVSAA